MPRQVHRLNSQKVKSAGPGRHADGNGLYLHVEESGAKSWVLIVRRGKQRIERGLGSANKVSLSEARTKARQKVEEIDKGDEPRNRATFGEVALDLISSLKAGWSNKKHAQQWENTLSTYAAALWARAIDEIGTEDVLAVLTPIWSEKPETASRVRGRMERVFSAAKVRGLRSDANPAIWKGHLEVLLPRQISKPIHHPAMPYEQLPDFLQDLRNRSALSARALEFLILTAARTSEVIDADWSEFKTSEKLWIVPADRMKAGAEHRVPLTSRGLAILEHVRFLGGEKPFKMSNMAMTNLLNRMDCSDYTVHGFRSSFRDWVGEETDFPREIAEAALAHQVGSTVERAYRRGDALEKRRGLMEAWEAFLCAG